MPKATRNSTTASRSKQEKPRYKTIEVKSALEFIKELSSLDYSKKMYWYRGIGDVAHELKPSLLRNKTKSSKADFGKLEEELNETFQMRGFPYAEFHRWKDGYWDQIFFMQHHRVPTRLLDWSGSPLVSLHFALTSCKMSNGKPENDVAVWILDPVKWNNSIFSGTSFDEGILSSKSGRIKSYTTEEAKKSSSSLPPIAIRGTHNSARIVAQQGFFTIFGLEAKSMEWFHCNHKTGEPEKNIDGTCLLKILIKKNNIIKMTDEMYALGISESSIYPDLEGLAMEIKRTYGF